MTSHGLQVVQFVHPGFEYDRPERFEHPGLAHAAQRLPRRARRCGVMGWKPGRSRHDRKFMVTRGSLIDWATEQDHRSVPLGFWGEWEGPSVYWRVDDSPGKPLPKIVHAPFRPATCPTLPVQNTDPMVFGEAFIYSNCLQGSYRTLRSLSRGSLVLFGRYARTLGRPSFSLDTCLIVERLQTVVPGPFDPDSYGTDLLADAVLCPLHTEVAEFDLTVYFGRRPSPDAPGPFSFSPARLMHDGPPLFARPELRPSGALREIVSPGNMQGIKVTSGLTDTDRDAIWGDVVQQVTQQGCGLGYDASPPPLLEANAAERVAESEPMPLNS